MLFSLLLCLFFVLDDFLSLITSSSNTSFLLDHRSTLCLHFISRLTNIIEQFPKVWTAKVLYLFDPSRPEVRRFVEQAKDQYVIDEILKNLL